MTIPIIGLRWIDGVYACKTLAKDLTGRGEHERPLAEGLRQSHLLTSRLIGPDRSLLHLGDARVSRPVMREESEVPASRQSKELFNELGQLESHP